MSSTDALHCKHSKFGLCLAPELLDRLFGQSCELLDAEVLNNPGAAFVGKLGSIRFERANDSASQSFGVLRRYDNATVADEQRRVADIRDDAGDSA